MWKNEKKMVKLGKNLSVNAAGSGDKSALVLLKPLQQMGMMLKFIFAARTLPSLGLIIILIFFLMVIFTVLTFKSGDLNISFY